MPNRSTAVLTLVFAVVATSFSSLIIREAAAPSESVAAWRVGFASLTLLLVRRSARRGLTWETLRLAVLPGLMLALHFALWIRSLDYTSVAVSVTFVAMQPLFAGLLSPLVLGERVHTRAWLGLLVTMIGAGWWFSAHAEGTAPLGAALALGGGAAAALYLLIGRRERIRVSFGPYWLSVNLVATVALFGWAVFRDVPLTGFPRRTWALLLLLAWLPHLIGHGLLNWSIRRLPALAVNVSVVGEPILAPIWAWLVLGELPLRPFIGAAVVMLCGILIAVEAESRFAGEDRGETRKTLA